MLFCIFLALGRLVPEVVLEKLRTSRYPWLTACGAILSPEDFKKSMWNRSRHMFIKAPGKDVSTCRSKCLSGDLMERTYDYVIASRSLQVKIRNMEMVEEF